jgi:protein SCO1/2
MVSCKEKTPPALPKLGFKKIVDGEEVDHFVKDWSFMNTDSAIVTNKDLSDVVYVSDFFFRSCPTICPKVAREMKRVYKAYEDNPQVKFVSFTLDPKRDTPQKLKEYAANLQVDTDKWWFLHGDKDETFDLTSEYMQIGYEDEDAPGGLDHSGKLILTDKEGHIRSFSEGTDPDETPKLIKDIKTLLKEYEEK